MILAKVYSFRKINFRRKGSGPGKCSAAQNNVKGKRLENLLVKKES